MKVILNVADNFRPINKDMLVYNESKKLWETKNYEEIIKPQLDILDELTKQLAVTNELVHNQNVRINRLVEIVKEFVKND